jgi:hypothetical protein
MKLREIESFTEFGAILIREEWERREAMGNREVLAHLVTEAKKEPDNPEEGNPPQSDELNLK